MSRIRSGFAALAVALGVYACGSDGIVLPDDSVPAEIVVLGGNGQSAQAGSTLGRSLEVRVTDAEGRPVANQEVTFTIELGGGEVVPTSVRTDSEGHASSSWTLGPAAGLQRVRAQAAGSEDVAVSFTATALAGSGSTLTMVSGDEQTGQVNAALPDPLVIRVVDPLGNPVSGQSISWSVAGGGTIEPSSSTTDENGEASAERVLGPAAGTQSAQAAAEGLAGSPLTFTHTAQASAPTSLVKISGDAQTAPAGFQLPESLVVQLRDDNGNGVAGRTVTWVVSSGSGVVSPLNSQTDADGYAVTRWTLGATAGTHTLNAVFSGLPSVPFTAAATADVPTTLELVSGDGQTGPAGATLPNPLRVRVADANDNPVENVPVTWTAQGGGSVSAAGTSTNAQGVAEVSRTLGSTPGTYTTTAAVEGLAGSPVTFTSTAEVGQPSRLAFLAQPSDALVGQTLATIQVEVQDAQGNRVPGATNSVTITSSVSGTLSGDNTEPASDGVATFTGLSLREANTGYRLTARASGLTNATSDPFDIAKGATTIDITGRSPGSSVTGQPVTVNFDVDVTPPAAGNLTGNVTVSDGAQSCTAGTSNAGSGSCQISFSTAGQRTLTATYGDDPNFEGSGSAGVSHTVNAASTTTTIESSKNPSSIGESVTFTATVTVNSPGAGSPSGEVSFRNNGVQIGTGSLSGSGVATFSTDALPEGTHQISARYLGNANFGPSTSENLAHQVANAPPSAVDDAYSVDEDGSLTRDAGQGVLANDTDEDALTADLVTGPAHAAAFTLNPDGSFSYTPEPDYHGPDGFTYRADDGEDTDQATVTITVLPVNDAPSFTKGADQVVSSLIGALGVSVPNWATGISPGPNEAGQTVTFELTAADQTAFSVQPAVDGQTGTLTYQTGVRFSPITVTVTVTAHDSEGGSSPPQQFTITINP